MTFSMARPNWLSLPPLNCALEISSKAFSKQLCLRNENSNNGSSLNWTNEILNLKKLVYFLSEIFTWIPFEPMFGNCLTVS